MVTTTMIMMINTTTMMVAIAIVDGAVSVSVGAVSVVSGEVSLSVLLLIVDRVVVSLASNPDDVFQMPSGGQIGSAP